MKYQPYLCSSVKAVYFQKFLNLFFGTIVEMLAYFFIHQNKSFIFLCTLKFLQHFILVIYDSYFRPLTVTAPGSGTTAASTKVADGVPTILRTS